MTAPSTGRDDATVRGAVVLVVAIVIGLALLARGGSSGGGDDDARADRSTESTETTVAATGDETTVPIAPSTSETTTPADDPASVTVAVLNATSRGGWAADNAGTIAAAGYQTVEGNFGGADADTSQIYATPEAQTAAQAVVELLGLQVQVAQKPAEPLGQDGLDAEADVVIVLGADSLK